MRSIVGLLILLVLAGGIGVLLWSRRSRDEIHSIETYRNALDTLQEMRGPSASASVRVLDPNEQEQLRQPPPPVGAFAKHLEPPEIPTAVAPPPGSREGMVFREDIGRNDPIEELDEQRGHHDPSWAISRMEPRHPVQNRQIIAGIAAGAVIVVLVVIGILIGSGSDSSTQPTSTVPSHRQRHSTTTVPRSATTTAPKITALAPQTSTATTATYLAPSGTYSVTVKATGGSVWTIMTSAVGDQVFAGAIDPGSPQTFKVSGGVEVNLGAPGYATVSIGGLPVTFPTGYQSPLVLTFTPAAPTPASTTTTAPVATTTAPPSTTTTLTP